MCRPAKSTSWLLTVLVLAAGCGKPSQPGWTRVAEDQLSEAQRQQRDKALAARDAMFGALKGRLVEVLGSEGPAAAISVCRQDAPRIAEEVAAQHGLAIGRTSFRLRNPENRPPDWAAELVEKRVDKPAFSAGPQGRLGVLLPIRLGVECLVCHGDPQCIPEPVKAALSENYPEDKAIGFAEGDLRGWFWVEVPADADSNSPPVTSDPAA